MLSDKSDWSDKSEILSDKSEILLREQLIGLVRPVGLFRAPIKPFKNLKWQPSTPPHEGDGGGFPLACRGFPPNKKAPTLAGAFNLQEEVSYLSSFM